MTKLFSKVHLASELSDCAFWAPDANTVVQTLAALSTDYIVVAGNIEEYGLENLNNETFLPKQVNAILGFNNPEFGNWLFGIKQLIEAGQEFSQLGIPLGNFYAYLGNLQGLKLTILNIDGGYMVALIGMEDIVDKLPLQLGCNCIFRKHEVSLNFTQVNPVGLLEYPMGDILDKIYPLLSLTVGQQTWIDQMCRKLVHEYGLGVVIYRDENVLISISIDSNPALDYTGDGVLITEPENMLGDDQVIVISVTNSGTEYPGLITPDQILEGTTLINKILRALT